MLATLDDVFFFGHIRDGSLHWVTFLRVATFLSFLLETLEYVGHALMTWRETAIFKIHFFSIRAKQQAGGPGLIHGTPRSFLRHATVHPPHNKAHVSIFISAVVVDAIRAREEVL